MKQSKPYIEHPGKVVEAGDRFEHVMAITLDPRTGNKEGIIRCIVSREGDVTKHGYVDRSELHKITGESLDSFTVGDRVRMKNEDEIINNLKGNEWDFIGLEDPDIWIDEETDSMHVYFTMPFRHLTRKDTYLVGLGHAVGKDLDSLEMTMPALLPSGENVSDFAKEVSIAPLNSKGFRYNLMESSGLVDGTHYSTVRVAIAHDMGKPWQFGETVFHPKDHNIPWAGEHASPGPLLPESFIDLGEGKRLGILNGREASQKIGDETKYGMFSVGLFIYDYEDGKIDWVSPVPLIIDSEAKTITFASQFVETKPGEGILYTHVDDSFVRAYTLYAEEIKKLLS